jgi:hypothetical protein
MTVLDRSAATISGNRHMVFRVLCVLFALFYAFLSGAVSGLLGSAWGEPVHRVHHMGGVLFIGLLVAGLLAQLRVPERNIAAFQQVAAGALAILIVSLIVGDPDNYGGNVGIIDPLFLIFLVPVVVLGALHPARGSLFRGGVRMSWVLAGIALAAAIPLAIYGVDQALAQRNSWPPTADPHHTKWFMMAQLAFAIPLVGLVASFKAEGWRVPAWSAGGAAIVFGLASVLYPDLASSAGRLWGSLSIIGGTAFIVVSLRESRRELTGINHGARTVG